MARVSINSVQDAADSSIVANQYHPTDIQLEVQVALPTACVMPPEHLIDARSVGNIVSISYHSGIPLRRVGEIPIRIIYPHRRRWYFSLKRSFDIIGATGLLIAFAPLILIIAAGVKLSSVGPVFFRQEREGLNRKTFSIFKFRTMHTELQDDSGIAHTIPGDTRVTKLGSFLRRSSLDELPQLLNILIGDMSFIGPRPHVPHMLASDVRYDNFVRYYHLRHEIKPGLTGWAQANGFRGPVTGASQALERVDHDLAYIQNLSFWLDLKIAVLTIRREFMTGSGL